MNVFHPPRRRHSSTKTIVGMAQLRSLPGSGKNVFEEYPRDPESVEEVEEDYSSEFENGYSDTEVDALTPLPPKRLSMDEHLRAEQFTHDIVNILKKEHPHANDDAIRQKIKAVWHAHTLTPERESIYVPHGQFLKAHLSDQMRDNIAVGIYRKKKVLPECRIPSANSDDSEIDVDEKIDSVLSDPNFGMFSLFMWHWREGYKNRELKEKNVVYCSHIFSLWSGLPILVFISQWTMYVALVLYMYKFEIAHTLCPRQGQLEDKILMSGVALLYFVKSFFLWDALVDRSRRRKVNPSDSVIVLLDGLQEIGFNLMCYFGNLWIVYHEENIINAILDSLAMEFLMVLDNQFEELYFTYLPGNAVKIYDNVFVTYAQNQALVESRKRTSCCYLICLRALQVPYKLLQLCLLIFPIGCLFMIGFGIYCK